MGINDIKNYKEEVRKKFEALRPVFYRAILGDFSKNIDINKDDEFAELYTGIQTILEVVRNKIKDLEKENEMRKKVEAELLEKSKDQEDARKAIMNVLEDLELSRANLAKERAQYQALLSSVKDGIFAVDKEGLTIFYNEAAEKLLLWKADEVMGKKLSNFFRMEDEKKNEVMFEHRPLTEAVKNNNITSTSDYYYLRKDGSRFAVDLTISPVVLGENAIGAVEVFRDITEEKRLDKEKSEFISIASHQLKTPIISMTWLVQLLSESKNRLDPKGQQHLNDLLSFVKRLSKLVENLLNVSRLELGTLKQNKVDIDLESSIKDFVKDFEPYADSKKHTIKLKKELKDKPIIFIDPNVLYDVMQNLVSNAIDYSYPDTAVTITIGQENGYAKVSVYNNGPTIPKDEQEKLFQKFYRGESVKKMKSEGTGLGLYIVKLNIENAGGKLDFMSEEGKETVFWFKLPLN